MTGGLKTQTQDIFLLNKKYFRLKIQNYTARENHSTFKIQKYLENYGYIDDS